MSSLLNEQMGGVASAEATGPRWAVMWQLRSSSGGWTETSRAGSARQLLRAVTGRRGAREANVGDPDRALTSVFSSYEDSAQVLCFICPIQGAVSLWKVLDANPDCCDGLCLHIHL